MTPRAEFDTTSTANSGVTNPGGFRSAAARTIHRHIRQHLDRWLQVGNFVMIRSDPAIGRRRTIGSDVDVEGGLDRA